jgi:patatin-like phospholipase/acyl hydrolase
MYKKLSANIFSNTFWYRLKTLWGIIGPKFPSDIKNQYYQDFYGDAALSDAKTEILIPVYAVKSRASLLLSSIDAKRSSEYDFRLSELIAASTSAPGVFEPSRFENLKNDWHDYGLDGGIFINNPVVEAYLYAKDRCPDASFVIVSLGTGESLRVIKDTKNLSRIQNWGFLQGLLPTFMLTLYAQEQLVDSQMRKLVSNPENHIIAYFRFNFKKIPGHDNIFDGSKKNIAMLDSIGDKLIIQQQKVLKKLIELIKIYRSQIKLN